MKCNKCEAELEEGVTLCPACGCENAPAQEPVEQEPAMEPLAEETAAEAPQEQETLPEDGETENNEQTQEEATEIKEGKLTPGKIALLVVLAVAAIAVIAALIAGSFIKNEEPATVPTETAATEAATEATVPEGTGLNDATCKGTYTVSDEVMLAQKDTVVATVGDSTLDNGRLQIYYWMQFYEFMNSYGSYASMLGMDYTAPLDTQLSFDGTMSWQQYFLDGAIQMWNSCSSLAQDAKAAGFELEQMYADYLSSLEQSLEDNAAAGGFENALAMIQADMGPGASVQAYIDYMHEYYLGYTYYDSLINQIEITDEEVEAYYTENEPTLAENGIVKDDSIYVDVRHILITPKGGTTAEDGTVTYSEEEWETCRAAAQEILDQWTAGEATEESFAQLANEKSEDPGSNTNGGLYEDVFVGQMVPPFEEWCFDETRQYGDTGLVKTDYGYHVMYFVGSDEIWFVKTRQELLQNKSLEILENSLNSRELEVDYSKMCLGFVEMG